MHLAIVVLIVVGIKRRPGIHVRDLVNAVFQIGSSAHSRHKWWNPKTNLGSLFSPHTTPSFPKATPLVHFRSAVSMSWVPSTKLLSTSCWIRDLVTSLRFFICFWVWIPKTHGLPWSERARKGSFFDLRRRAMWVSGSPDSMSFLCSRSSLKG